LLNAGACWRRAHRRGAFKPRLSWRLRNGAAGPRSAGQSLQNKFQKAPESIPVFNSPFV